MSSQAMSLNSVDPRSDTPSNSSITHPSTGIDPIQAIRTFTFITKSAAMLDSLDAVLKSHLTSTREYTADARDLRRAVRTFSQGKSCIFVLRPAYNDEGEAKTTDDVEAAGMALNSDPSSLDFCVIRASPSNLVYDSITTYKGGDEQKNISLAACTQHDLDTLAEAAGDVIDFVQEDAGTSSTLPEFRDEYGRANLLIVALSSHLPLLSDHGRSSRGRTLDTSGDMACTSPLECLYQFGKTAFTDPLLGDLREIIWSECTNIDLLPETKFGTKEQQSTHQLAPTAVAVRNVTNRGFACFLTRRNNVDGSRTETWRLLEHDRRASGQKKISDIDTNDYDDVRASLSEKIESLIG